MAVTGQDPCGTCGCSSPATCVCTPCEMPTAETLCFTAQSNGDPCGETPLECIPGAHTYTWQSSLVRGLYDIPAAAGSGFNVPCGTAIPLVLAYKGSYKKKICRVIDPNTGERAVVDETGDVYLYCCQTGLPGQCRMYFVLFPGPVVGSFATEVYQIGSVTSCSPFDVTICVATFQNPTCCLLRYRIWDSGGLGGPCPALDTGTGSGGD